MKLKLTSLNTKGLAHFIMPLAAFVMVGVIGGIVYLYGSHQLPPVWVTITRRALPIRHVSELSSSLQTTIRESWAGFWQWLYTSNYGGDCC